GNGPVGVAIAVVPVPTAPAFTLLKTVGGTFTPGGQGTYTLTVTNSGDGATDGTTVTLTDTLPAGLTAASLSGTGWTCVLATLTCTRTDALDPGESYPPITLTVNVSSDAPAQVTNTATVSGGGTTDTSTATATTAVKRAEPKPTPKPKPPYGKPGYGKPGYGKPGKKPGYGKPGHDRPNHGHRPGPASSSHVSRTAYTPAGGRDVRHAASADLRRSASSLPGRRGTVLVLKVGRDT
ncbi:DUF11 domain-containing protein, partial [Streptomyces sp. NPDC127084]|uniref:DUF11 domain-containing protein n=1 Tax=Streptomyces sp. NPDC127084 TaxID=3347133 RepID=UPI00365D0F99